MPVVPCSRRPYLLGPPTSVGRLLPGAALHGLPSARWSGRHWSGWISASVFLVCQSSKRQQVRITADGCALRFNGHQLRHPIPLPIPHHLPPGERLAQLAGAGGEAAHELGRGGEEAAGAQEAADLGPERGLVIEGHDDEIE